VRAAHARYDAALHADPVDPVELADAHVAFHASLLARCPSAWMRRMVALLADHAQRYQLLGASRYRRGSDPEREHLALRDAAVRGQVDRAVDILVRHLDGTLRAVRATIEAAATPKRRKI
jgi:DNA-binding GntR family transcriptional regulator